MKFSEAEKALKAGKKIKLPKWEKVYWYMNQDGELMADNVNHPAHYETGKFECIDVMVETQGVEATQNFCVCNALKYVYRHKKKNGMEDLQKAIWYLNKAVELEEAKNDKTTNH